MQEGQAEREARGAEREAWPWQAPGAVQAVQAARRVLGVEAQVGLTCQAAQAGLVRHALEGLAE